MAAAAVVFQVALAMRWLLNDLASRLDETPAAADPVGMGGILERTVPDFRRTLEESRTACKVTVCSANVEMRAVYDRVVGR
jgi:hypothetical protein